MKGSVVRRGAAKSPATLAKFRQRIDAEELVLNKEKKHRDLEERKKIVEQAIVLFEQNYAHLPLKVAIHAVNPVQALRLLRGRLERQPVETMASQWEFHAELSTIFNSVRDLHTRYVLPKTFENWFAYLPFLVEAYWGPEEEGGSKKRRRYVVTHLKKGAPMPTPFDRGVEVSHWNGVPIERAVELNAARFAGSNEAARHARGIEALTLRALRYQLPPDEEWVAVTFKKLGAAEGEDSETRQFNWEVLEVQPPPPAGRGDQAAAEAAEAANGLDPGGDAITQARRFLFAPDDADVPAGQKPVETKLRGSFRARKVTLDGLACGHLRIFSFQTKDKDPSLAKDADAFLAEFLRLLGKMPEGGLILDLRGNSGGNIRAAERLLQTLTSRRIEPEPAQFIATPLNMRLCEKRKEGIFKLWHRSMVQALATGAAYSGAFPITCEEEANAIGRRYHGPVVLITDARCYSAADIFAAGFQDHAIGPVLGVDANTGAGGANAWEQETLRAMLPQSEPGGSPYRQLDRGVSMRVSLRRTLRVGTFASAPVEDLGVTPDERHYMTSADVLEHNGDLLKHARMLLIGVTPRRDPGGSLVLDIVAPAGERAEIVVGEQALGAVDLDGGKASVDLEKVPGGTSVRVEAYAGERLVGVWARSVGA